MLARGYRASGFKDFCKAYWYCLIISLRSYVYIAQDNCVYPVAQYHAYFLFPISFHCMLVSSYHALHANLKSRKK